MRPRISGLAHPPRRVRFRKDGSLADLKGLRQPNFSHLQRADRGRGPRIHRRSVINVAIEGGWEECVGRLPMGR
jgi:hypothetical protein